MMTGQLLCNRGCNHIALASPCICNPQPSRFPRKFNSFDANSFIDYCNSTIWRGGRVVECAGFENRLTARLREFESPPLRYISPIHTAMRVDALLAIFDLPLQKTVALYSSLMQQTSAPDGQAMMGRLILQFDNLPNHQHIDSGVLMGAAHRKKKLGGNYKSRT